MSQPKSILKSKTFWFNLFVALFGVLTEHTELLRSVASDGGYMLLLMVISAVNLWLRSVTCEPVKISGKIS